MNSNGANIVHSARSIEDNKHQKMDCYASGNVNRNRTKRGARNRGSSGRRRRAMIEGYKRIEIAVY